MVKLFCLNQWIYDMSELFREKYRIKSARLCGWDYSLNGVYLVTICTHDREHHFGEIENKKMCLSAMGKIVDKFWREIPQHFSSATMDASVVMPNHVHGILVINNGGGDDGGCGGGDGDGDGRDEVFCRDAINRVSTCGASVSTSNKSGGIAGRYNSMGKKSLGEIVRWFKGRCTFEIHQIHPALDRIWQPRFHDRIIRDKDKLDCIREYIFDNPKNWEKDRNNPKNLFM